jgi:hypothetical protein
MSLTLGQAAKQLRIGQANTLSRYLKNEAILAGRIPNLVFYFCMTLPPNAFETVLKTLSR